MFEPCRTGCSNFRFDSLCQGLGKFCEILSSNHACWDVAESLAGLTLYLWEKCCRETTAILWPNWQRTLHYFAIVNHNHCLENLSAQSKDPSHFLQILSTAIDMFSLRHRKVGRTFMPDTAVRCSKNVGSDGGQFSWHFGYGKSPLCKGNSSQKRCPIL